MNHHDLPDSGVETKIAVLRGEIQGLTNEFRFSSKSQGERIGAIERELRSHDQEIASLHTDIKVMAARMSAIGGGVSFLFLALQLWFNIHR